ncbi:ABC transporter ATP-binding protein [Saccharopolyspora sp. K220]|uniref:ABC transporter ATP-binding protein n=1 Tax=Saccharopolyspora soli TaxID=2926618 RepID=UPI001F560136|nr:ABC transporter ATP-binding protein [Saccharopolyspora soli]MCI2422741.1 ABC transporter ATP-binding protein [Saccharopolyspora soli]
MPDNDNVLLEVRGLKTHFPAPAGTVRAVDGVDLTVRAGKTLCVVGESGCGKSMTARSLMQLVEPPGKIVAGEVLLHRRHETIDLAGLSPRGRKIREVRGRDIAMIFQEPMTSLSLVHRIGDQLIEAIRVHRDVGKRQAREQAIELLAKVGIPRPDKLVDGYPFQLSGGMRQRAMIAMALSCEPDLLIADEPTTALDVTTQAQIMELLAELQRELGMAILLITHDLGVVAEMADEVAVMYLGTVVEQAPVDDIFHDPRHPYTRALLKSIPRVGRAARHRLESISGAVPSPHDRPTGCPFHPRCPEVMPGRCDTEVPTAVRLGADRHASCLLHEPMIPSQTRGSVADDR